MDDFAILNTRKRVVIALIHTVVFFGVALSGLFTTVNPLQPNSRISSWVLTSVYLIVSAILLWLVTISGAPLERCYFGFCATSASFGLLRQVLGDQQMHVAVYVRIAMLACAVLMGVWLLRAADPSTVALPAPPDGARE